MYIVQGIGKSMSTPSSHMMDFEEMLWNGLTENQARKLLNDGLPLNPKSVQRLAIIRIRLIKNDQKMDWEP